MLFPIEKSKSLGFQASLAFSLWALFMGAAALEATPTPTPISYNPDPCTSTSQVGAVTPFTSYEAEAGTLGGGASIVAVTTPPASWYSSPELEASGHAYVRLNANGQYVEWTNNTGQNITAVNLRSYIPDAPGGGGIDATINLYVNGAFRQAFAVNSHQNYCYEEQGVNYNDQTDKTPAAGYYARDFWNDTRAFVSGAPITPGSTFRFQLDSSANTAAFYGLDVVDVENPPPALAQPANSLSIASYGATPNDITVDNTTAINNCFAACQSQGKIAWIPAGTWYFSAIHGGLQATGITIQGAGYWYSTLYRVTPANNTQGIANIITGVSCILKNVMLDCNAVSRAGNNNNGAIDFSGDNWLVDSVWIEHVTSSFWCAGTNGVAQNCRTLSTWADGGNFNNVQDSRGIGNNLTYQNNFVRGTGDDGMAINSVAYNVDGSGNTTYYTMMSNITYQNNTSIAPWGGQCMGIYGGNNDIVRNNLLQDSPRYTGLGVTRFGVNGSDLISASVTNNTLWRCGGNGYGQQQQAIMIGNFGNAQGVGTIANTYVGNNTVNNALYDAMGLSSSYNNVVEGNVINAPGQNGIAVGSATLDIGTATGYAILHNNTVTNLNFAQSAVAPQGGSAFVLYTPTLAASYNASSGVTTENCSEGLQDVGFISNGSYTEYNQVTMDNMLTFTARVASGGVGGSIQIRLDSPTGTLLGTCAVPATGCWQGWQDVTCGLSPSSGAHNLYLVYTGGAGNLFNIQWFFLSGAGMPPTPTPTPGPAPGCPQADNFTGSSLAGFWSGANIGNASSSSVVEAGSLSVTTGSGDIAGTADNFFYIYQTTGQNLDARLKVNFTAGNWNAKSGIMLRESLNPGAVDFYIAATYSCCGYESGCRTVTAGTDTVSSTGNGVYSSGAKPGYLRVVRNNNTFTSYYSGDGSAWTVGSSQTLAMASTYLVGVGTSTGNGSVSTANYNNFTLICSSPSPTPTPTASPWPLAPSITASPTATLKTSFTQTSTATPSATLAASLSPSPSPTPTPSPTASPSPVVQSSWRVNAGGANYTDSQGNLWVADTNYSGGTVNGTGNTISGTADPTLYQTERWGNVTYSFNVPAGSYQVTLKFVEMFWNAVGKRVFNVSINGTQVLTNLDIFSEVGQFKADDKVFNNISPNASGQIVIQLGPASADNPEIAALQIIPMPSPTATPTVTISPSPSLSASPTDSTTPTMKPSASPTVSLTSTPTASVTASATRTASPTATSSATLTVSPTPSATTTASMTRSGTVTLTTSSTATATPTPTASKTTSTTNSATPTATLSASPTLTGSATATLSLSPSLTVSLTNTYSVTASATPSASKTASSSPSAVASLTATSTLPVPSPTASASSFPTATASTPSPTPALSSVLPTLSFSATPPSSSSPTSTATAVQSAPSFTPTPSFITPTASFSATPSLGPLNSATMTPLATLSGSVSPTLSCTVSQSATLTMTPSNAATASPSTTPSMTPTATLTVSYTPSVTGSATRTASATVTISPSPLLTESYTSSATLTAASSSSPTLTASPSAFAPSPSVSPTSTFTPGASLVSQAGEGTAVLSLTSVVAGSSGVNLSISYTAGSQAFSNGTLIISIPAGWSTPQNSNPSAPGYVSLPAGNASIRSISGSQITLSVFSLAAGASLLLSYQNAVAPAQSGTSIFVVSSDPLASTPQPIVASPSLHVIAAPSPTANASGDNGIVQSWPVPNPNPLALYVDLRGPADEIRLRVYSKAMLCVLDLDLPGAYQAGWNKVSLPAAWANGLASDIYYGTTESLRSGQGQKGTKPMMLYILK